MSDDDARLMMPFLTTVDHDKVWLRANTSIIRSSGVTVGLVVISETVSRRSVTCAP